MAEQDASIRHSLPSESTELFAAKLAALREYHAAQAKLNEANIALIKSGFRLDGAGIMSW